MNVQEHMSGQISGQVPNQLPQQNGNPLPPSQLQNLISAGNGGGAPPNMFVDPELDRARTYMREKIFSIIVQRQAQPASDQLKQKFKDISKRLEKGLFQAAQSKEDYMNLSTLENRILNLIKRTPVTQNSQQMQQMLTSHQLVSDTQNGFSSLPVGATSDPALPRSMLHGQHVHEDFGHLTLD